MGPLTLAPSISSLSIRCLSTNLSLIRPLSQTRTQHQCLLATRFSQVSTRLCRLSIFRTYGLLHRFPVTSDQIYRFSTILRANKRCHITQRQILRSRNNIDTRDHCSRISFGPTLISLGSPLVKAVHVSESLATSYFMEVSLAAGMTNSLEPYRPAKAGSISHACFSGLRHRKACRR